MTIEKILPHEIGIHIPYDYDPVTSDPIVCTFNDDTGMELDVYPSTDDNGYLLGISSDAVGLVTWYRLHSRRQVDAFVEQFEMEVAS